jgi:2-polyprenyl-6-methoxyphenol hydroxylase-like FAD-dependent oxidoreductase
MAKQILVIGAGIAGLAAAVALQRRGHDVTVIEERTDASSGAGISIWPNALAALDEIGLGDPVREAGGRVTAGALRRRNALGCVTRRRSGWSVRWANRWS